MFLHNITLLVNNILNVFMNFIYKIPIKVYVTDIICIEHEYIEDEGTKEHSF